MGKIYKTTDTALSAYLILLGYKFVIDKANKDKVVYEFEYMNKAEFDGYILEWETSMAEGNLNQFYRTYRGLLNQIKS